jgi:hypothetical protein
VISQPIKSVAADSNGLLSAIAGRAARKVFEVEPPIEVVTTEVTIAEVEEYLPEFAKRYALDLNDLMAALPYSPSAAIQRPNTSRISTKPENTSSTATRMMSTLPR